MQEKGKVITSTGVDMCKGRETCATDLCQNPGEVWVVRALWWVWHRMSLRSSGVRWRWEVESTDIG